MAIKLEFTVETRACVGVQLGRAGFGKWNGKEGKLGTVGWGLGILSGTLWRVTPRLGKEVLSQ